MRIAILTSGVLPVPAVQGGAVENLIDFCIDYNNRHHLHNITIYSINHPRIKDLGVLNTDVTHYHHIDTNSWIARIRKRLYKIRNREYAYYHYTIEYYLKKSLQHIQKNDYDIILVENRPGYALKLKDRTTAKLVLHQGNDFLNSQTLQSRKIYEAYCCIINTSAYITNRVRTINPSDTKCKTVLNGIDTQFFFQAEPFPRIQLGLTDKDFVIAYSGRLNEEKGILPLIQAIKQLGSIPNCKLLIIGASSYGKDKRPTPFIKQLMKEAESIKEQVIFTGFINYQQVPSYLKMADIAIVPSMWEEPFGLTVVEAMAAGLPLITTRSGGIPEICENVATIVDRDNIADNLATAILDLYEHPKKRKQMAAAGLSHAKLFDKDTYAKNFFKALENI